ncbi:MAG: hypothetical protein JWP49_449 [Phenylobacterium sp.]|nr:hypothetical protein [Phenylobacterium sp.]
MIVGDSPPPSTFAVRLNQRLRMSNERTNIELFARIAWPSPRWVCISTTSLAVGLRIIKLSRVHLHVNIRIKWAKCAAAIIGVEGMNRRQILLAILAAADGQPFTPVQIQKATFLVTRNLPGLVNQGQAFNFSPYDYGPFDSSVYSEAELLRVEGLADVNQSSGRWRTYAASPQGILRGKEILAGIGETQRDYIQKVAAWVRSLDFATLVKSIYEAYPETKVNSVFQG